MGGVLLPRAGRSAALPVPPTPQRLAPRQAGGCSRVGGKLLYRAACGRLHGTGVLMTRDLVHAADHPTPPHPTAPNPTSQHQLHLHPPTLSLNCSQTHCSAGGACCQGHPGSFAPRPGTSPGGGNGAWVWVGVKRKGSVQPTCLPPMHSVHSIPPADCWLTDSSGWVVLCLQGCEFLVGGQLTLADIVVCCDLYHGFTKVGRRVAFQGYGVTGAEQLCWKQQSSNYCCTAPRGATWAAHTQYLPPISAYHCQPFPNLVCRAAIMTGRAGNITLP